MSDELSPSSLDQQHFFYNQTTEKWTPELSVPETKLSHCTYLREQLTAKDLA